jgi:sugar lactone lactonase YvrE
MSVCSTLIAEISNSRVIFSDTSTPPVPSAAFHATLEHVTVSSRLEWSPDGCLAYYNDTATHRIDVFDYDRSEGLTARRPFNTCH